MKKIIFVLLALSFVFVIGCTEFENLNLNGDPIYQCKISSNPDNPNCGNSWSGHMCQIYDPTYSPSAGIPDHCTTFCLNRSDYLNTYDPECIVISVEDSLFAIEDDQTPKTYLKKVVSNLNLDIIEEDVDEESKCSVVSDGECPSDCGSTDDYDCCESYGKSWTNGTCQADNSKCQVDSDCPDVCDGSKIVDNYCDNSTFTCKVWKENDCSTQKETIAGKEFSKTCSNLKCTLDKASLETHKKELSDSWKEHSAARQALTGLEYKMDDIMLKQAEGLTQELMISTYTSLNFISGSFIQILSDLTVNAIEEGLSALGRGDEAAMSKGETFVWAYNNRTKIRNELDLIDAKLELLSNLSTEINNKLSSLS
jgi:hypothetical protein